jgi:hypothetical protein
VAYQADVGNEDAREHDEDEGCCPGGDFVGSDTMYVSIYVLKVGGSVYLK